MLIFEGLWPLLTVCQYLAAIPGEKSGTSEMGEDRNQILDIRTRDFFAELYSLNSLELVSTATSGGQENIVIKDLMFMKN